MNYFQVDLLPVLIATVLNMLLGMAWYSKKMFGTAWMQMSGITEEHMKNCDMKKAFSLGILATFTMSYMINVVINLMGASSVSEVLTAAGLVWIATVVPGELHGMAWENRPFKLMLINASNALLTYLIAAYVVQNWGM